MLRRQMQQPFRKPLIVMTPKSLLRHKLSVSPLEDLTRGSVPQRHRRGRRHPAGQGHARRVLLRQGLFRPARFARARTVCTTSRSCASSSSIRSRPTSTQRSSASTRTRARSSGARKSRRTRAPGTRSGTACRSRCRKDHQLLYAGRAPAAAPATGILQMHTEQQQSLVDAALRSTSTEESLRQTTRLTRRRQATGQKISDE